MDQNAKNVKNARTTTSPPVVLERELVDGSCPRCGAQELRAYPVNSEGGWFNVIKCQNCLLSVSRERGPRLGPIQLLSDRASTTTSPASRSGS